MSEDDENSINGELYCLYNEMYNYYGNNVRKLGNAGHAEKRMKNYCTSYVTPCEIQYKSKRIRNKRLAESILFIRLADFRVVANREFFNCDLEIIKTEINYVCDLFDKYTDDEINEQYAKKQQLQKIQKITSDDINNAIDISDIKYEEINNNIIQTMEEKILLKRHKFKMYWNINNPTTDFINKYYDIFNKLENLRLLVDNSTVDIDLVGDDKINMMHDVIDKLGFVIGDDKLLEKDTFEKNIQIVKNECKLFTDTKKTSHLFKFHSNRVNEIQTIKSFMGFFNTILRDYGLIISLKQKTITVQKDKKRHTYKEKKYKLNFVGDIINFV